MTVSIIGANVLTEQWRVVAATKTKTILVQSKSDDNSIGCQFNLRLRYGVEGVETPIYSQETTTFLEPNQARLIDFRELVPGDFQDSYPVGAWQIEAQIAYNFAPILVRYYEVDLRDADKAFYQGQLNSKADSDHEHVPSDIANLETLLLAKLNAPTTPPTPGQILRATGPDTWTWQTVASGDGGGVVLPAEIVTTVNGESGDVILEPPPLATATQSGLISAQLFALLTGQNATNGQVLQFTGGTPTWGNLTVSATPVQWQKLTANATLETDKHYFLKGGSEFTLPATVSGSIEVSNQTTTTVTVIAAGTARINGIGTDNSTAISQQERVRIKPGKSAKLIADSGNWESQDCDNLFLRFTYNGNPLTPNLENPEGAGDLFEFLGIQAAKGTSNRWVNPAGTSWLQAVQSSGPVGSSGNVLVLSNRNAPSGAGSEVCHTADAPNSFFAWQLPAGYQFEPTGVLFLLRGDFAGAVPRNFDFRVSNGTSLSALSQVTTWAIAQSFVNQNQITNTASTWWHVSGNPMARGRQLAFLQTAANSGGSGLLVAQEFCWFGNLYTPL
ncbi:hypothetical protein H6F46_02485 [Limnothrix sp. FACHB-1083]|uniref:hypothetical protein n=1 Tax=unclassified Limnothrix TaxID=2632864 RepID=UPI0016800934|nr:MULTISPECIES: hypothetical protein [unclassified Limnothrix]MBD2159555.1 hypothetical protein [Limnothrix sp. FACHB-1083]MBD2190257.1 hypothetical protein [Limnothrix sp. FACHB-1088]